MNKVGVFLSETRKAWGGALLACLSALTTAAPDGITLGEGLAAAAAAVTAWNVVYWLPNNGMTVTRGGQGE